MRLNLLAALLFACAAQACMTGTSGDRVEWCWFGPCAEGKCPEGETCSAATPAGLTFSGPPLSGDSVWADPTLKPVAVGGIEDVIIDHPRRSEDLPDIPFVAHVSSQAIEAASGPGWRVQLRGISSGTAMLRIVDPDTGELFDRIEVTAAPIHMVSLEAKIPHLPQGVTAGEPWRVVTGSRLSVFAEVWGPAAERVVDQTLAFELEPAGIGTTETNNWDGIVIVGGAPGVGTVSAVAGGVGSPQVLIEVLDGLDEIRLSESPTGHAFPPPTSISYPDSVAFCHHGFHEGKLVVGVDWSYDAPDIVQIVPAVWEGPITCIGIGAAGNGHAVVRIRGGGLEESLEFDVSRP